MTPTGSKKTERPAIGLRLLAVVLAILPFAWMADTGQGDRQVATVEATAVQPSARTAEMTAFEDDLDALSSDQ